MLRQQPDRTEAAEEELTIEEAICSRPIKAKRPNHIWHADLTVVPTAAGFWVPWSPFFKLERWPCCWWVAVVIDHFSRRVCGIALFTKMLTSAEVCAFLDRVTNRTGAKPKHIITDKGRQFFCVTFKSWCRARGVRPRFGAVGRHGSIAVIERFFRSMKTEFTRRILVPLIRDAMRYELGCYATWYNQHRPHQYLDGRTPAEVHRVPVPATNAIQLEPRPHWPLPPGGGRCHAPRIHMVVKFLEGRRHLPVVELKRAA